MISNTEYFSSSEAAEGVEGKVQPGVIPPKPAALQSQTCRRHWLNSPRVWLLHYDCSRERRERGWRRGKKKVVKLSAQSGVSSSFTAFIAVNENSGEAIQGPLVRRDVPTPVHSAPKRMGRFQGLFSNMKIKLGGSQKLVQIPTLATSTGSVNALPVKRRAMTATYSGVGE
ncbi:von Willebrand factor A domain-containing protein 5A-like [Mugil cephalus]|uniref:von Willebrand factor A domain-containing protein 5A-like n=1 Tax=Mugil cephalus TaxID=48193 RepID=UPI001FB61BE4|nr:von Willebrand factor A domain-containing protein 5A-like [Mugil cephalus]